jgi:hypothetical protein
MGYPDLRFKKVVGDIKGAMVQRRKGAMVQMGKGAKAQRCKGTKA